MPNSVEGKTNRLEPINVKLLLEEILGKIEELKLQEWSQTVKLNHLSIETKITKNPKDPNILNKSYTIINTYRVNDKVNKFKLYISAVLEHEVFRASGKNIADPELKKFDILENATQLEEIELLILMVLLNQLNNVDKTNNVVLLPLNK